MKARDVVGRQIVAIYQHRRDDLSAGRDYDLSSIELDNGSIITFTVAEGGSDYAVIATVHPRATK